MNFEKYYIKEFRKKILPSLRELRPNFTILFFDIFLGFGLIVVVAISTNYLLEFFSQNNLIISVILVLSSLLYGFFISYLSLFVHEAAHYNLHPDKKINDFLANTFLCIFVFQSISNYRKIHLDHHKFHGTVNDTENSYFNYPSIVFLLQTLFLYRPFKVLFSRSKKLNENKAKSLDLYFIYPAFLNLIVVIVFFNIGDLFYSITWIAGLVCFYPFFASLRQIIEHRDPKYKDKEEFFNKDHGEFTIHFKKSIFSHFFGGAGFRSHIIHHLEPSFSYTLLDKIEKIFLENLPDDYKKEFIDRKTTYLKAFLKLV